MTIQELLSSLEHYQTQYILFFIAIPITALIVGLLKKTYAKNTGLKLVDSVLIYLVSVPGVASLLLSIYSLFILRSNLLELNILVYFLPVISMIATYVVIQKTLGLKEIPGFGKISSLLLLISLSMIIVLLIQKMFIGIIFIGSIWYIIGLFAVIFIGMKLAFDKLVK